MKLLWQWLTWFTTSKYAIEIHHHQKPQVGDFFFSFLAGWLWNIHQLPFSVVVRCSTCLVVSWDPVYGIPCIFSESQGEFVCRSFPSFPTSIQQKQRLSQQHSKTKTTWTQAEMRKKKPKREKNATLTYVKRRK